MVNTEREVAPDPVTEEGENVHELSDGKPEHEAGVNLMVPVKPSKAAMPRVRTPPWPRTTVRVGLLRPTLKSGCKFTLKTGDVERP